MRAVAFKTSFSDTVKEWGRAVKAECDARIRVKTEEYDPLFAARDAKAEALRQEKGAKVEELLSILKFDRLNTHWKCLLSPTECPRKLRVDGGKRAAL